MHHNDVIHGNQRYTKGNVHGGTRDKEIITGDASQRSILAIGSHDEQTYLQSLEPGSDDAEEDFYDASDDAEEDFYDASDPSDLIKETEAESLYIQPSSTLPLLIVACDGCPPALPCG